MDVSPNAPRMMPAEAVLDREYLEIRAKLLEVAASFDRLERGDGSVDSDPRMQQFRDAMQMILNSTGNRAEQLQLIFSRSYAADWRRTFQLSSP